MRRPRPDVLIAALFLPLALSAQTSAPASASARARPLLERILIAEDARAMGKDGIIPLLEGLSDRDPQTRRIAVRAVGRLQRPQSVERLTPLLRDPVAAIRSEAANAIAQAVAAVPTSGRALDSSRVAGRGARAALVAAIGTERDRAVVGVLARSLGRLRFLEAAQLGEEEQAILDAVTRLGGISALADGVAFDVLHGLNDIAKARRSRPEPSPAIVAIARQALATSKDVTVRRLAVTTLGSSDGFDSTTIAVARHDADPEVRRGVLVGNPRLAAAQRDSLVAWAFADPSPVVRYEAFRLWRRTGAAPDCTPVVAATRDPSPAVALAAIDALGETCTGVNAKVAALRSIAEGLPLTEAGRAQGSMSWHGAAHAIVALARADRAVADSLLPRFVFHRRSQVREYAARAATTLRDTAALSTLLTDGNHNVQAEAMAGWAQLRGRSADQAAIGLLRSNAHQVIMAAAAALKGARGSEAPTALLDALDRLTTAKRENSRDARVALLTAVQELGTPALAARVEPYLVDFDSTVAQKAASILGGWSGQSVSAFPAALPIREEPLARTFAAKEMQLRITMSPTSGGGVIVIRLFADEAPATVARLVRLAKAHYYDGLSIHRIVPNFVIQGGSPDANEYVGDAAFMRDELGLRSHLRGTVGISTRGRDTGDAQFFVNLVDNVRLDHDYTVVGQIVQGLNIADGILEGDIMAKVEVIERNN